MKKFFLTASLLLVSLIAAAQPRAKYVFYFIGDGMGVNQVNAAETYLAELQGRHGFERICFTQFPHMAFVHTFSENSDVTDSAAAGTALAAGFKTKNSAIGVLPDLTTPCQSIAVAAKAHGAAVGIATSVSIDHATPAVFYAHNPYRWNYYEIGEQLGPSGFDFFAGSDFNQPVPKDYAKEHKLGELPLKSGVGGKLNLYKKAEDAGYTIVRGYDQFLKKYQKADRLVLFQNEADSRHNRGMLPYAIDRTPQSLSLEQITRAGIDFLLKQQKDGFFYMVEGGQIDVACHANEPATFIRELLDMDKCVEMAYQFYLQHPDETLIVVSADHETGGMGMGRGSYELHLDRLQHSRSSLREAPYRLRAVFEQDKAAFTWEKAKQHLTETYGFWDKLQLTEHQEKRLHGAYDVVAAEIEKTGDAGSKFNDFANAIKKTLSEQAHIGWISGAHTNGYVGAYAIGVGAEQFNGVIDNTEIPKAILRAAGWE